MRRPLVLVVLSAIALSGCGLLREPCGPLEERLCADLGPDCALFQSEPRIREAIIPVRRRRAERAQCEMFAADVNYSSYTLPYVRYLVRQSREPSARMPALPRPQAVDGLASGFSSWFLYLLAPLAILAILFYSWRARRNLAAARAVPAPMGPASLGTWDHVDSREKAEELARLGALFAVELLPRHLGGEPVPQNVVFLPLAAATRKAAIDAEVTQLLSSGQSLAYSVEPRYRGTSFVPASLVVRVGEQIQTVDVW